MEKPMPLKGKVILTVDDETDIREILIEELQGVGATVVGAENGQKAMEILRQQSFDAVISDFKMPYGNGLWLMQEINKEFKMKPKLFLFTGSNDGAMEVMRNLGVIEVFIKPFNIDYMIKAVSESLNS